MTEHKPSPWSGPRIELIGKLVGEPVCPECGEILDGFGDLGLDGAAPRAGDISVCFHCATLLEFYGDPLAHRHLEGDELILALADPRIRRTRNLILQRQKGM